MHASTFGEWCNGMRPMMIYSQTNTEFRMKICLFFVCTAFTICELVDFSDAKIMFVCFFNCGASLFIVILHRKWMINARDMKCFHSLPIQKDEMHKWNVNKIKNGLNFTLIIDSLSSSRICGKQTDWSVEKLNRGDVAWRNIKLQFRRSKYWDCNLLTNRKMIHHGKIFLSLLPDVAKREIKLHGKNICFWDWVFSNARISAFYNLIIEWEHLIVYTLFMFALSFIHVSQRFAMLHFVWNSPFFLMKFNFVNCLLDCHGVIGWNTLYTPLTVDSLKSLSNFWAEQ